MIAYDDSDGWYDHAIPDTIGNSSFDEKASSLLGMFAFERGARRADRLLLDPSTGERR